MPYYSTILSILNNGAQDAEVESCFTVDSMSRKRQVCGKTSEPTPKRLGNTSELISIDYDHVQGPGKIITMPCSVKWALYLPFDLKRVPYFLLTSHGVHLHPPPPPRKTPEMIIKGILDVLKRINNPDITIGL